MANKTATVITKENKTWVNKHLNVQQKLGKLYDVWNPQDNSVKEVEKIKSTVKAIQKLIGAAVKDGKRLRAYGGSWSLSRVAIAEDRMINTKPMNLIFTINKGSTSSKYTGDYSKLLYTQCGASVQEVNRYLKNKNLSLKTTGASNGQTIAGAVSTGTHGSAIDVGSMQDYVVGIHLITSANKHIILERESYPVTAPALSTKLGAELIKDDELFNNAVISFGSFGFIHALILETEPIYLLEMRRKRLKVTNNLKTVMDTLDFSKINLHYPNERPYHFEMVFNPYDIEGGAYVTTMHKRKYKDNYPKPEETIPGIGPGDDLLSVIGTLTDFVPELIPAAVKGLVGSFYKEDIEEWGTIGEIFKATDVRGKGASTEMGIPMKFASKALETILDVHKEVGPVACIIAFRYVKGSNANLAFTKYDTTCAIEIQAVHSNRTKTFYKRLWEELIIQEIPYTFHWGQMNNLNAKKIRAFYGKDVVDNWLSSRSTLLKEPVRKVFYNEFMKRCGLE